MARRPPAIVFDPPSGGLTGAEFRAARAARAAAEADVRADLTAEAEAAAAGPESRAAAEERCERGGGGARGG